MDVNGRLIVKGQVNDPVLSGVVDTTDAGRLNTHKKGVLKFSNGFKIQWDTINATAGDSVLTLLEPFTEDSYTVVGSWSDTSGASEPESTVQFHIPTADKLTTIGCRSADDNTKAVTYIVFGKDSV